MESKKLSKREFLAQFITVIKKSDVRFEKEEWATLDMLSEMLESQRMEEAARELNVAINSAYEMSRRGGYEIGNMIACLEKAIADARNILKSIDFGEKTKSDSDVVAEIAKKVSGEYTMSEYRLDRFPILQSASAGLGTGYYVFVGAPGVGKTAFVQNILLDALQSNVDAVCYYYSFDDMKRDILRRFVSMETVLLSRSKGWGLKHAVGIRYTTQPASDETTQAVLLAANEYIKSLIDRGRLRVFDRTDVATMSELRNHVAQARQEHKRLIVGCDAVLKIDCSAAGYRGVELDDYRADCLDEIASLNDIPFLTSHEQRKRNGDEQKVALTLEDTKGSGRYGFNAKFGALVYPKDRPKFKDGTNNRVLCYVDKSKMSDRTGSCEYIFNKAYSHLEEAQDGNFDT